MKSLFCSLIGSMLLMILASGCGTTSADRVALLEGALVQAHDASAALDVKIETIEAIVTTTREALADPNVGLIVGAKFRESLDRALDALAELSPAKEKADALLVALEARLAEVRADGPVDLSDEIALAAAALTAGSGVVGGKAGLYMTIVASILGTIGGLIPGARSAKRARAKQETAEVAVTQIVRGLDKALASRQMEDADDFLGIVGAKQTAATEALVDRAQGKTAG